jgi:hypothetical protein
MQTMSKPTIMHTPPRHWPAYLATVVVLLLGSGAAYAQEAAAANGKKAADKKDAPEKNEVLIEKGEAPPAPKNAAPFYAQKILDAQVTPVLVTMRRWIYFENGTVVPRDNQSATLKFDVAFDSFRNDLSHTAAWVFFKVRTEGSSEWQPVRLIADKPINPTGYGCEEATPPLDVMVPGGADGFTGLFLRLADQNMDTTLKAKGVTVYRRPFGDGKGYKAIFVILNESEGDVALPLEIRDAKRILGGPNTQKGRDILDVVNVPAVLQASWKSIAGKAADAPALMDLATGTAIGRAGDKGERYGPVFVPYHDYRILYAECAQP